LSGGGAYTRLQDARKSPLVLPRWSPSAGRAPRRAAEGSLIVGPNAPPRGEIGVDARSARCIMPI